MLAQPRNEPHQTRGVSLLLPGIPGKIKSIQPSLDPRFTTLRPVSMYQWATSEVCALAQRVGLGEARVEVRVARVRPVVPRRLLERNGVKFIPGGPDHRHVTVNSE